MDTVIDPESKPGPRGRTFRNAPAFVQPLCNFFKIADGVLSKFHAADAFDTAKRSYYEALESHVNPINEHDTAVAADEPLTAVESLQTVEKSAKALLLQRLDVMADLLGTLQYLPDSCVPQMIN